MWLFFGALSLLAASMLAFMDMRRQRDDLRRRVATGGTTPEGEAMVRLMREGAQLRQTIPYEETAHLTEHAERVQLWSREARRLIDRLGGAERSIADQELGHIGYDGRRHAAPELITAYIDARLRSLNEVRDRI